MHIKVLIIFVSIFVAACNEPNKTRPVPIENFDVNRYLGQWYEIARTDNSFEKGCTDVTANYSLRQDGGLNVVNRCLVEGKEKVSTGRAYFRNKKNIGSLRVTFFWPFYGDYNIIYLDENYQYALVEGGSKEYLWILARKPTIEDRTLAMLVKKIEKHGLDPKTLIYTTHRSDSNQEI